jgi:hypothetical protein
MRRLLQIAALFCLVTIPIEAKNQPLNLLQDSFGGDKTAMLRFLCNSKDGRLKHCRPLEAGSKTRRKHAIYPAYFGSVLLYDSGSLVSRPSSRTVVQHSHRLAWTGILPVEHRVRYTTPLRCFGATC